MCLTRQSLVGDDFVLALLHPSCTLQHCVTVMGVAIQTMTTLLFALLLSFRGLLLLTVTNVRIVVILVDTNAALSP